MKKKNIDKIQSNKDLLDFMRDLRIPSSVVDNNQTTAEKKNAIVLFLRDRSNKFFTVKRKDTNAVALAAAPALATPVDDPPSFVQENIADTVTASVNNNTLSSSLSVKRKVTDAVTFAAAAASAAPPKKKKKTTERSIGEDSCELDVRQGCFRGLKNLGNTCYAAASLQMICTMHDMVSALKSRGGELTSSVVAVAEELQDSSATTTTTPVDPAAVKKAMDAKTDKFHGYQQRDAHEFISHLVDYIHEEVEEKEGNGGSGGNEKMVSPMDDFLLIVEVCLTCQSCGYDRCKQESFRHLSVDIIEGDGEEGVVSRASVEKGLAHFFQPEIREIRCEKCKEGTHAMQTLHVLNRPKALLLHLKRFIFEQTDKENESPNSPSSKNNFVPVQYIFQKNKAPVCLPEELTLAPFEAPSKKMDLTNTTVNSQYHLKSIVHHIGSRASSGHYTADAVRPLEVEVAKAIDPEAKQDGWVTFDDGSSYVTTLQKILANKKKQTTAYMLLYSLGDDSSGQSKSWVYKDNGAADKDDDDYKNVDSNAPADTPAVDDLWQLSDGDNDDDDMMTSTATTTSTGSVKASTNMTAPNHAKTNAGTTTAHASMNATAPNVDKNSPSKTARLSKRTLRKAAFSGSYADATLADLDLDMLPDDSRQGETRAGAGAQPPHKCGDDKVCSDSETFDDDEHIDDEEVDNDDDSADNFDDPGFQEYQEELTDLPALEDDFFDDDFDFDLDLSAVPNYGSAELPELMSYGCNPHARPHYHKAARRVNALLEGAHMVRNAKGEFRFDFASQPITKARNHIGYANYDEDGNLLKNGSTSNAPERYKKQAPPKYIELFHVNKWPADLDKPIVEEVFSLLQSIIDDPDTPYELKLQCEMIRNQEGWHLGFLTNIGTQLGEMGCQLQWDRSGVVGEAGMMDVPVLVERVNMVKEAVELALPHFKDFVGVELIDALLSWPTGAKEYVLKSKIVAIEYILGKDKKNWKDAFEKPAFAEGKNATEIFTPPSDPAAVTKARANIETYSRRKKKFLGILDTNKTAMPGDRLHRELVRDGFSLKYRVFGTRVLHYESEIAIMLVIRPLCRYSDSRSFISVQENIAGCMTIEFLASIVRYVQGGTADTYERGRPNALTAGAVLEQTVVGAHLGKRVGAAMARGVLLQGTGDNACAQNGLGKANSRTISKSVRLREARGEAFYEKSRPLDSNVLYRAANLMSYATTDTIGEYARRLHAHFHQTVIPAMTQNKHVKLVNGRWEKFLKEWIVPNSRLYCLLLQERLEIRQNSGNPNPRTDYDQDETNDDFQTMLNQNGGPFFLPVDGNTDRTLSPINPNNYPVLRQLVHDSVRQRTAEYKAPEGNTNRTQLADRNHEIKLEYYPDAKRKQISNGFVLCRFVRRENAWKTSVTKAEKDAEFASIIALAAPSKETATHFYLRDKGPASQEEEDMRPVPRSDAERVFWKVSKSSVSSRLRRLHHLGIESVGPRLHPVLSNGFRLYWMKLKSEMVE